MQEDKVDEDVPSIAMPPATQRAMPKSEFNDVCRRMEESALAQWRSLSAGQLRPRDGAAGEEGDARWSEQLLARFVSVQPFSSPSPEGGGHQLLTRRSEGWAAGVARLCWWTLMADGPHSCLSFLDDDDDHDHHGDCGHDAPSARHVTESDREKEELFGVLCRALGENRRRGEKRWLRAWFGRGGGSGGEDESWIVRRLWTRVRRAVLRRNEKPELAIALIQTIEWLINEDDGDDINFRSPPPDDVAAGLRVVMKPTTHPDIICTQLPLLPLSLQV
jgi:hypothetical protein